MEPVHPLFVPGRLCLFGEHSDWAGALRAVDPSITAGACIVSGTDQGLDAMARASSDFEVISSLPDGTTRSIRLPMRESELRAAAELGGFFSYAAGVAVVLAARHHVGGLRLEVTRMDLPLQRGLSSSAAVCVLTARAFSLVYGLGLSLREEMELAYQGEIVAGSQCGRMDQACAYGRVPVRLLFDGEVPQVEPLHTVAPVHLLIVDLRRHKDTRRILADLQRCFRGAPGGARDRLRAALGIENRRLVDAAVAALADGDACQLGRLMTEAQARFDRDVAPLSPHELAAPKLHAVLAAAPARALAWGGKGVGSQGDGAAQFVCRGPNERRELAQRLDADHAVACIELTIEAANVAL